MASRWGFASTAAIEACDSVDPPAELVSDEDSIVHFFDSLASCQRPDWAGARTCRAVTGPGWRQDARRCGSTLETPPGPEVTSSAITARCSSCTRTSGNVCSSTSNSGTTVDGHDCRWLLRGMFAYPPHLTVHWLAWTEFGPCRNRPGCSRNARKHSDRVMPPLADLLENRGSWQHLAASNRWQGQFTCTSSTQAPTANSL